jgi:cobalamin biosynthesis Mg chelatase CobN
MALSFLSGDAGTPSLKALEAQAYAMEAAKKLKLAKMLQRESDASIDAEFLGLDEISRPMTTVSTQSGPRQARTTPRTSNPEPQPTQSTPVLGPNMARLPAPSTAKAKPSMMVPTMQTESRTSLPKMTTKAKTETNVSKLTPELEKRINVTVEQAKEQAKEAAAAAQEAKEEAVKEESAGPMSFLKGKNALIIGGIAVAAIAGFYFFKKK